MLKVHIGKSPTEAMEKDGKNLEIKNLTIFKQQILENRNSIPTF